MKLFDELFHSHHDLFFHLPGPGLGCHVEFDSAYSEWEQTSIRSSQSQHLDVHTRCSTMKINCVGFGRLSVAKLASGGE